MACPICKKSPSRDFRPFCSKRCADVDLGRWMTGRYVVPGEDGEAADRIPTVDPADAGDEE